MLRLIVLLVVSVSLASAAPCVVGPLSAYVGASLGVAGPTCEIGSVNTGGFVLSTLTAGMPSTGEVTVAPL